MSSTVSMDPAARAAWQQVNEQVRNAGNAGQANAAAPAPVNTQKPSWFGRIWTAIQKPFVAIAGIAVAAFTAFAVSKYSGRAASAIKATIANLFTNKEAKKTDDVASERVFSKPEASNTETAKTETATVVEAPLVPPSTVEVQVSTPAQEPKVEEKSEPKTKEKSPKRSGRKANKENKRTKRKADKKSPKRTERKTAKKTKRAERKSPAKAERRGCGQCQGNARRGHQCFG